MNRIKYLVFVLLFSSSNEKEIALEKNVTYEAQVEIKRGNRFYVLNIAKNKEMYVIKGESVSYYEPLNIKNSDTSNILKLDSTGNLFVLLDKLKERPILISSSHIKENKVEIRYEGKLVYLNKREVEPFWDMVRPIIPQIPEEWNPFFIKDNW